MKDHELVLRALNKAELIVGDYLKSGHPRPRGNDQSAD